MALIECKEEYTVGVPQFDEQPWILQAELSPASCAAYTAIAERSPGAQQYTEPTNDAPLARHVVQGR
jgi:hypothetical protein